MTDPETGSPGESRRRTPPGVRWIALGALAVAVGVTLADRIAVAYVERRSSAARAAGDPDLEVIQAAVARGATGEMTDEQKNELRSAVAGEWPIVATYALGLLLLPFAIGVLIGRGTSSVLGAAIAVAAGAVAGLAMQQVAPLSFVIGAVIYFGLGALAGLIGRRLAARRATV
jgi:hypothetical protein